MTISVPGLQSLLGIVGFFGLLGLIRGWRRMGIVFIGTVLTALVLLDDKEERLMRIVNSMPKVVDLLLDTKFGVRPLVTEANKPYFLLAVLATGLVLSWLLSSHATGAKGFKLELAKPLKSLGDFILCLLTGAGTGYLLVTKAYEYVMLLPGEAQKQVFQTITIVLLPLPSTNVLKPFEPLLYVAGVVAVAITLIYVTVYGKGYSKGKSESEKKNKGGGGG